MFRFIVGCLPFYIAVWITRQWGNELVSLADDLWHCEFQGVLIMETDSYAKSQRNFRARLLKRRANIKRIDAEILENEAKRLESESAK